MSWSTSTIWVDAGGAQTIHRVRTAGGIGALLAAIKAASNGDWAICWEGPETPNAAAPVAAQYLPVAPAALLYFHCADGSTATIRIPAPLVSIFLADQVSVNPANATVAALVAASVGTLQSSSGSLATSFLAGVLESLPRR